MYYKNSILSKLRSFKRDKLGTIAMGAGLGILTTVIAIGAATDYSRISHTKHIMADALDAAILASAKDLSEGAIPNAKFRADFEDFFLANLEGRAKQTDRFKVKQFNADAKTGIVSAKVQANLQMAFMGIIGKDRVKIRLKSEVQFRSDEIEVAMMLDVTGSMRGNRLRALKLAATNAIDILIPESNSPNGKVRIGLVPYAASVNAGNYAMRVTGNQSRGCVVERVGRDEFTETSYRTSPILTSRSASCPRVSIRALTKNTVQLKNDILSYSANGMTGGHMGIAWTYYMLSNKWNSLWPNVSDPKPYSDKVQKIAILMTDGTFNQFYHRGPGYYESNSYKSVRTAIGLCNNMKLKKGGKRGITIYSIAFSATSSARATLRACASPDEPGNQHYFTANSQAALDAAFRQIALNIQKMRLTK